MAEGTASDSIELNYAKAAPKRWWQRKWVWQLAVGLGLIWAGWKSVAWGRPVLGRYRCYRMEQQAAHWPTGSQLAGITYTPPGRPVSSVLPAAVLFQKSLWAVRSVEAWKLSSPMLSATPVFCHALTTQGHKTRLVQIYVSIDPATVLNPPTLKLCAISLRIPDRSWVLNGSDLNDVNTTMPDAATSTFVLRTPQPLSVSGGTLDASDPSTVTLGYTVAGHPCSYRIHLIDSNELGVVVPRLAMEVTPDPYRLPGSNDWYSGFGMSGFFKWPIAAPVKVK